MTDSRRVLSDAQRDQLTERLKRLMRANGDLERQLRSEREQTATEQGSLFLELLEVLDMLDGMARSLEAVSELTPAYAKRLGRSLSTTRDKLKASLEHRKLERIPDPADGLDFSVHKVIEQEVRPELPPQTVLKILKQGYRLSGRVLRPTEVVTSRNA